MQAGEHKFLEMLDQHGPALLAMLRRLCGNSHNAEDAFQETAVRVWRALNKRPRLRHPRAWLFTIAYRVFLDQQNRQPALARLNDDDLPIRDTVEDDPATQAERSECNGDLEMAVRSLPEKVRSVIVLHYSSQLSLRETARVLEISVGTAKSRLHAGLKQLRNCLDAL